MVKKMRVWPYIIISTTDGSASTAARPTSQPTIGWPITCRTWTSASFEQTSGSIAPLAMIAAQRPAISAVPGASTDAVGAHHRLRADRADRAGGDQQVEEGADQRAMPIRPIGTLRCGFLVSSAAVETASKPT